jgi:hypothetical protein
MKVSLQLIAAGIFCLTSAVAAASQQGGGTSSMLCAVTNTVSCDNDGECLNGPATAVNLPVFMLFHPEKKIVESAMQGGERRTSEITSVGGKGDVLVMLGDEEANGWSMRIDKADGSLTGTIAADGAGYLIFGSCLPH